MTTATKPYRRVDGQYYPVCPAIENLIDRLYWQEVGKGAPCGGELNYIRIRYKGELYRKWVLDNNVQPIKVS